MTWTETEKLVDDCISQNLNEKELNNIVIGLPIFVSSTFVIIYEKKTGKHLPV